MKGNKSLQRTEAYVPDSEHAQDLKIFHFSLDDFIVAFEDLTFHENIYSSIFENTTFKWLEHLHDKYGVIVSCYVFYETDDFSLDKCTRKFQSEFEANSDWLRFGFHSRDSKTIYGSGEPDKIAEDYRMTIHALKEIVGAKSIDNVIRLQSFYATENEVEKLVTTDDEPIVGLLTADDLRQSYYLSEDDNQYIYCHDLFVDYGNKVSFYSTDLRIEFIADMQDKIDELETNVWNNQKKYMIVFTHEWEISNKTRDKTEKICNWAKQKKYIFAFLEDVSYNSIKQNEGLIAFPK